MIRAKVIYYALFVGAAVFTTFVAHNILAMVPAVAH